MQTLIEPPNFELSGTKAFFTTKKFTGSKHIIDALADKLDISTDDIYLPLQKHTSMIHILRDNAEPAVSDAVITARKGVLIGVLVADCVPVLLYDRRRKIAAAVHAGWRGTARQILGNTVKAMAYEFGCRTEDMLAAIGPSIRRCSYEVGWEVIEEVRNVTGEGEYYCREGDKYYIDLSTVNMIHAQKAGILYRNIWQSHECTFCSNDRFYSYRYSRGSSGRQGGFIIMW